MTILTKSHDPHYRTLLDPFKETFKEPEYRTLIDILKDPFKEPYLLSPMILQVSPEPYV